MFWATPLELSIEICQFLFIFVQNPAINTLQNHLLFTFSILKFFIKRHTSSHVLSDDKVQEMSFQGHLWGPMYPVRGKKVGNKLMDK
jgi:hypothetical protein